MTTFKDTSEFSWMDTDEAAWYKAQLQLAGGYRELKLDNAYREMKID